MTIPAVYRSLDERRRNARRSNPRPEAELAHDVAITLTPLPVWADLDAAALRAKHAALVADIDAEHAGATVLGADHLIAEDPDATSATKLEPSPAPACHAFCARVRARFLASYATFRDRYKRDSERLRTPPPGAVASTTPTSRSPERRPHALALTRHPPCPHRSLTGRQGGTPGRSVGGTFGRATRGKLGAVSPSITPHVRSNRLVTRDPGRTWGDSPIFTRHARCARASGRCWDD